MGRQGRPKETDVGELVDQSRTVRTKKKHTLVTAYVLIFWLCVQSFDIFTIYYTAKIKTPKNPGTFRSTWVLFVCFLQGNIFTTTYPLITQNVATR